MAEVQFPSSVKKLGLMIKRCEGKMKKNTKEKLTLENALNHLEGSMWFPKRFLEDTKKARKNKEDLGGLPEMEDMLAEIIQKFSMRLRFGFMFGFKKDDKVVGGGVKVIDTNKLSKAPSKMSKKEADEVLKNATVPDEETAMEF